MCYMQGLYGMSIQAGNTPRCASVVACKRILASMSDLCMKSWKRLGSRSLQRAHAEKVRLAQTRHTYVLESPPCTCVRLGGLSSYFSPIFTSFDALDCG